MPLGFASVILQWRCFEVRRRLGDFNQRKITFQAHGLVEYTPYSHVHRKKELRKETCVLSFKFRVSRLNVIGLIQKTLIK